jgi:hypothetical protein
MIGHYMNGFASLAAFLSAVFWGLSASVKVPNTEDWNADDPQPWLTKAAKYNRWAAAFAGVSALLFGGAGFLSGLL